MSAKASQMIDEPILLRRQDGVIATLTLNRPAQYNALSEEMLGELQAALEAIAADAATQVLVIEARGKAFCAGHDLKQMRARPERAYYRELFGRCSKMMLTLTELPQTVIAKVQGLATAAGCQLVATCDLAVAAKKARFATSGINVGLFCSTPAVALSRNVGRKRAFEMLMTGDFIDAATALDIGLVNRVAPAAELDAAVDELARNIASKSPVSLRTGKAMFYKQLNLGLNDAYAFAGETMACDMMAEDAAEGIDAFIAKRHPVWKGK